jgi:hypothetical protein
LVKVSQLPLPTTVVPTQYNEGKEKMRKKTLIPIVSAWNYLDCHPSKQADLCLIVGHLAQGYKQKTNCTI